MISLGQDFTPGVVGDCAYTERCSPPTSTATATKGITGIYAPGVQFTGPIYVGDIDSRDNAATPMFVIGSCTDTRITGGDLLQASGQAVRVSGLGQLRFTAGVDANGNALSAKANRGVLRDKDSNADVTLQTVVNP